MRMAGHEARPGLSEPRYWSGRTVSVRRSTSGGTAYRFSFSCGDRNYKHEPGADLPRHRDSVEPTLILCVVAHVSIIFAGATVTQ